jgi:PQQ-like domain
MQVHAECMFPAIGLIVRRRRRTIMSHLAAATAALLLLAGALLAWQFYSEWRLGRIELVTEDAPVVAQVLAETSDTPIGEPFDLVTRAVVALPAGDYRLRVNGKGRLGRTYRFAVNRGETQVHTISIDEGRLLGGERPEGSGNEERPQEEPIRFVPLTAALELTPGKADLIEWSSDSVIRRDAVWGTTIWDTSHPVKPFDRDRDPNRWVSSFSPEDGPWRLLERASDFDGDGTRDLLWLFPSAVAFLALSGEDGSVLWNYAAELDGQGGPDEPQASAMDSRPERTGDVIGMPALADVDGDGAPDVIATIIFAKSDEETARRPATKSSSVPNTDSEVFHRRVVTAVSGRSGRWLWSYSLDKDFISIPKESWERPAAVVEGRRRSLVAATDGTQWLGLDQATGRRAAGPFDLGFIPIRQVQHADLDGDGEPEVLALGPGPAGRQNTLHAFSTKDNRELWSEPVGAPHERFMRGGPPSDFPLIVDLDADGRFEIVVPDSGPMPPLDGYRGVKLLEGLTGKPRWHRLMRPDTKAADGLTDAIAAPDLDGDGTRDLAVVSHFAGRNPALTAGGAPEGPVRAYVDAISGRDGRPLWWWHVDLPTERRQFTRFWPPQWWGRGPDGWPLLLVPIGGAHRGGIERDFGRALLAPPIIHLLEASTGKEQHTIDGLTGASIADLDGDGLADLWGKVDRELRAFRGEAPEAWRALGRFGPAYKPFRQTDATGHSSVDFDGDGIADTLIEQVRDRRASVHGPADSFTALARSGRDGRVIWKTLVSPRPGWFERERVDLFNLEAFPLPEGDFDGDGTPDVIATYRLSGTSKQTATLPMQVLSGRTGRLLWRAGPLPLEFEAQGFSRIDWVHSGAVERGSVPDLFVSHGSPFVKPGSKPPPAAGPFGRLTDRPHLARVSARDGRILWDVSLVEGVLPSGTYRAPRPQFADLDGDGALDALVPSVGSAGRPDHTMAAVSLRDGTRLWSQPLRFDFPYLGQFHVGDLDGNGRPDVVVVEQHSDAKDRELQLRAFDGRDGKLRWTWNGAADFQNHRPSIVLAQVDGGGTTSVFVDYKASDIGRQIVVLDGNGKERARHAISEDNSSALKAADLNGDGRDEVLLWYGNRLCAWGPDLKEIWSVRPEPSAAIERVFSASQGRPAAVILNPSFRALDGATGQSRWTGQAPLVQMPVQFGADMLDPGDSARLPILIGDGLGATVCRVALPTTSEGAIAPPRGALIKPGRVPADPRWSRPLPWDAWLKGITGPWGFSAAAGLAFVNVVIPLLFLRLVAGRRRFSIRALMALPVAAAIPLMCFLVLEPELPVGSTALPATERRLFAIGTLAGVPIVFCALWIARSLTRLCFKPSLAFATLTVVGSLAIAALWLWFDRKSMSAVEHYDRTGWYLVALPGAYVAAVVLVLTRATVRLYGFGFRSALNPTALDSMGRPVNPTR